MFLKLAAGSLLNRRLIVFLTVLSISISTLVLLGVEHVRKEVRDSFSKTISGADLIVGARTGQINLLLYSVFRIGNATNNISWDSYQDIAAHQAVSWTIPISLGDAHQGYRVLGTNSDYFTHFRYGNNHALELTDGIGFNDYRSHQETAPSADFKSVIGAEVASRLGYRTGDTFVVAHGTGSVSFSLHEQFPVEVAGILAPTGTPVDQTIHISLETMEALHNAGPMPRSITAFIVGLESRLASFALQRQINGYRNEALMAILPGVALAELWQMMGTLERVLSLVAGLVLVASLLGMATMLLSTLQQRSQEIMLLRMLGAGPATILMLIQLEALLMTLTGIGLGVAVLSATLASSVDWISTQYGIFMNPSLLSAGLLPLFGVALALSTLMAMLPAVMAYRSSRHARL